MTRKPFIFALVLAAISILPACSSHTSTTQPTHAQSAPAARPPQAQASTTPPAARPSVTPAPVSTPAQRDDTIPNISMSKDSTGKTRTFLLGKIEISGDLPTVDNKSFTSTLFHPLHKGDVIAAYTSEDQAWSGAKQTVEISNKKSEWPILAMVKCTDGAFHSMFPIDLNMKTAVAAGTTANLEDFQIESTRAITAGQHIPAIAGASDSMLSMEADDETKPRSETKPWLAIYKQGSTPAQRATSVEAWRMLRERAGK